MRRPATIALQLLLVLFLFDKVHAQIASIDERLGQIEQYVSKARADWNVPGLAIAIVKDDRVIFAKGYGVRQLNEPTPVDSQTLFAIASNSKAFTAAAIGILVDEGKVRWDDPVTKYLPWFQMYDPYVTREITVRDLLSHRSGLATFGGDLLWYESTYPRKEILRRIRYLKPTSSFRSSYGYQNIMFLAAGEVVESVTGKPWDDFIRERFFTTLNMVRSNTSIKAFKQGDNVATPHNEIDGKLRVIRYSNVDSAGGAAAINSSVAEMAQWLRLQLGRGALDGKRIFSTAVSRELWQPNTVIRINEQAERFNPTRHFNAYGLGLFLSDYHGRKMVSHGGGLDGMISQVAMLPEEKLGVVVLSNSETSLPSALVNKIFDTFLGLAPRDWSAELLERSRADKAAVAAEAARIEASRALNTKPSLALDGYSGVYTDPMYGDARVSEENGRLVLRLVASPNFVGDLEHWQFDTFRVKWRDSIVYPFPRGFVSFTLDKNGKSDQMKIDVPNPDFDFTELDFHRQPAKQN